MPPQCNLIMAGSGSGQICSNYLPVVNSSVGIFHSATFRPRMYDGMRQQEAALPQNELLQIPAALSRGSTQNQAA